MLFFIFLLFTLPVQSQAVEEQSPVHVHHPKNPIMKVLLGDALQPTQFTATSAFVVENDNRKVLMTLKKNEVVNITYENGTYTVRGPEETLVVKRPVQVTPLRSGKVVKILNFENRPAWNTELNDNIFFHTVKVIYSAQSNRTLLVNEIGLERYVSGIAETGGETNLSYVQALLTAARTYALYNIEHCTKFPGEPYCLDASANSQVYKGAGYTHRAPLVVQAQLATRGMVITYNGEPIIAPYFSHSDGRTRSWSEVWNGDYPWAVSVADPCCTGETLYGHGVGLSGEGARYFADLGWGWKKILKYYYTGVKITPEY